ncbi:MAG: CvpA family protein [Clostridia bacterium]
MYFDIFAFVFVLAFSFIMMKKGGAQALLSLISLILSVVIALFVYPYLSTLLYETPVDENISAIISESLMDKSVNEMASTISAMPDFIAGPMENLIAEDVQTTCDRVSDIVTKNIVNIITFILVLVVTKLILAMLFKMLDIFTGLPLIKQANSLVGFLCGLVLSFVILSVVVHILGIFAVGNESIAPVLENSYVAEIVETVSPF